MNTMKYLTIAIMAFAFIACKKEPGTGGKTTLKGKLIGTYICEDDWKNFGRRRCCARRTDLHKLRCNWRIGRRL